MIIKFHFVFVGLVTLLSHSKLAINKSQDTTTRVLEDNGPKVFDCSVFSEKTDIAFLKLKV